MVEPAPVVVELEPQEAVTVRGEVAIAELPAFFSQAFADAMAAAAAAGLEIVGPPFAYYPAMPGARVVVEAGFPVGGPLADHAGGRAHRFVLPGGRAVEAIHVGPYEAMAATYTALLAWMGDTGLEPAVGMWECYLSDPTGDPATWRTRILWPVAEV